jgi:outer membrane lipoprotein carrier protein
MVNRKSHCRLIFMRLWKMRISMGIILLAVFFYGSSVLAADKSIEILRQVQERYTAKSSYTTRFVQTTRTGQTDAGTQFEGEMTLQPPNRLRLEVTSPDTQLVFSDGTTLWFYLPSLGQAMVIESGVDTEVERIARLVFHAVEEFRILESGEEEVGGVQCVWLELRPIQEGNQVAGLRIWVTPTHMLQKLSMEDAMGQHFEFQFLQWQVGPIRSDSFYTFVPPQGIEVIPIPGSTPTKSPPSGE